MMSAPAPRLSREGIGASQAAAAAGLNDRCPPILLYEELHGLVPPVQDNAAMHWGRRLEAPIREEYVERTGSKVIVPDSIFHVGESWRRASPDGVIVDPAMADAWRWGLEIKTASHFLADEWGDEGTDDIPLPYLAQVAWSMHVTDLPRWDVAALIGGRDFRCYTIPRDLEFEEQLVAAVTAFWEGNVLAKVPPPVDGSQAFREYLERRFAFKQDVYLIGDERANQLARRLRELRAREKDCQTSKAVVENQIRELIGELAGLDTEFARITWKPQQGRELTDWEAVARNLAADRGVPELELEARVAANTRRAKSSRPFRFTERKTA